MLNFGNRRISNIGVGDTVIVNRASNASLNLYMKAKQNGLVYIKCPCNAKSYMLFVVTGIFGNGFLLKCNTIQTVAHPNDLRKVQKNG